MTARIGVDFDNTIVCYDRLFHRLALRRGLIPTDLPAIKRAVRDHLRDTGAEDLWTELQGEAYGPALSEATAFPGVEAFFRQCARRRIKTFIVSHKTRHPYRGPAHDLHLAAEDWLDRHGFFEARKIGLPRGRVFLELTKKAKLARIGELRCTHFIDDLPELLAEPSFPAGVDRILFDPERAHARERRFRRAESWTEIARLLGRPRTAAG